MTNLSAGPIPTSDPRSTKSIMLDSKCIGIHFVTVFLQIPVPFLDFTFLSREQLLCHTDISFWMEEEWAWVENLVRNHQVLRVILLLLVDDLPPVYRPCNCEGIPCIYSHPVQVSIIVDPAQILQLWHVSEKAHSLQKTRSSDSVFVNHQLVLSEF